MRPSLTPDPQAFLKMQTYTLNFGQNRPGSILAMKKHGPHSGFLGVFGVFGKIWGFWPILGSKGRGVYRPFFDEKWQ